MNWKRKTWVLKKNFSSFISIQEFEWWKRKKWNSYLIYYGVLKTEQVDIFSSVHSVHLLLLLFHRGPWSEIFNKGDRVSQNMFFVKKLFLCCFFAPATVNQPFLIPCTTFETHLPSPSLALWYQQLAFLHSSTASCIRLMTFQDRCDWSHHHFSPADTKILGAKHKKNDFGLCMSLPPQPSTARPLPPYIPVHQVPLTG